MTPIYAQLVKELGDPFEAIQWELAEAAIQLSKWFAENPDALQFPRIEVPTWSYRWQPVHHALGPVLKEHGVTVRYETHHLFSFDQDAARFTVEPVSTYLELT